MPYKRTLPQKLKARVEHLDDERAIGNGYMVTLRYGWTIDPLMHCGVFSEGTLAAVQSKLETARPCDCAECRACLAKAADAASGE